MLTKQKTVATPSKEYQEMLPAWEKIDALMDGTEGMRDAGKKYLPQFPAECDAAYKFRLSKSTLFNVFKRTVENMAARPFVEPVTIADAENIPPEWLENIDMLGHDLHGFAYHLFQDVVEYGLCHVLVDHMQKPYNVVNMEQEKALGLRPYLVKIEPSRLIGWKSSDFGGSKVLTQVRIKECVYEDNGGYELEEVEQIRVINVKTWEIHRKNKDGVWYIYSDGDYALDYIPLTTVYACSEGFMDAEPPLEDLADLNIKHWQSQSDQDSLLNTARVPILLRVGIDESEREKVIISSKSIVDVPLSCDLRYVEHSGAAISAGAESLKTLEDQMQSMGAELLLRRPGNVTATQTSIETAQSQSKLGAMVKNLENGLNNILSTMCDWRGIEYKGRVNVFSDFNAQNAGDMDLLLRSQVAGLISKQTYYDEARRRGIVNSDIDYETEQARIAEEPVNLL